jgi:hypothetical protein
MDRKQLDWFERELEGHQERLEDGISTIPYSSGKAHGSEVDLRVLLEPLFIKYGMDVVFAGHEHFYERIKPQKGIYYFTCGGSAQLREGNIKSGTGLTEKGFDSDRSFMVAEVAGDTFSFQTISLPGQTVDSGTFQRTTHRIEAAPGQPSASGGSAKAVGGNAK